MKTIEDTTGKDMPENVEVNKAFEILQRQVQEGHLKCFIIAAQFNDNVASSLGTPLGSSRNALAFIGDSVDLGKLFVATIDAAYNKIGDIVKIAVVEVVTRWLISRETAFEQIWPEKK